MKEGYSNEKELEEELEHFGAQMRKYLTIALIAFVLFCLGLAYYLFGNPWSEPTGQPKQDTTAKVEPPTASIKGDTIVFDLERIGELDRVDTLIQEGIETLEERLNNETEIK